MSLIAKGNKTFKPAINDEDCLETSKDATCGKCAQACPEGIDPRHPERGALERMHQVSRLRRRLPRPRHQHAAAAAEKGRKERRCKIGARSFPRNKKRPGRVAGSFFIASYEGPYDDAIR